MIEMMSDLNIVQRKDEGVNAKDKENFRVKNNLDCKSNSSVINDQIYMTDHYGSGTGPNIKSTTINDNLSPISDW